PLLTLLPYTTLFRSSLTPGLRSPLKHWGLAHESHCLRVFRIALAALWLQRWQHRFRLTPYLAQRHDHDVNPCGSYQLGSGRWYRRVRFARVRDEYRIRRCGLSVLGCWGWWWEKQQAGSYGLRDSFQGSHT